MRFRFSINNFYLSVYVFVSYLLISYFLCVLLMYRFGLVCSTSFDV